MQNFYLQSNNCPHIFNLIGIKIKAVPSVEKTLFGCFGVRALSSGIFSVVIHGNNVPLCDGSFRLHSALCDLQKHAAS